MRSLATSFLIAVFTGQMFLSSALSLGFAEEIQINKKFTCNLDNEESPLILLTKK